VGIGPPAQIGVILAMASLMARLTPSLAPQELKARLASGLLAFPATDFDAADTLDTGASAARLEWLAGYRPAAFFMAGGAGEFFSLTAAEYGALVAGAAKLRAGGIAVLGAAGYGTRIAVAYARETERHGADGLLLLPPYLTEAPQEGLAAHIEAVCKATGIGVVVYNRANCRLQAETLARLAEACPNLVGFKDGIGDTDESMRIRGLVGDRLVYLNGMPTAETYAPAFAAQGFASYSSAIFNFVPRTAMEVHRAVYGGDRAAFARFEREFLIPYVAIRARRPGYAVSIVKAGSAIVGRSAGKVRPPLCDLAPGDTEALRALIARLGAQD
jgi:5-dehydro-4-deoxyglucarate dehydratase